jgi:hypothetical protein
MIISQVDRLWHGHHFHFALERWRRGEGGGQKGGRGVGGVAVPQERRLSVRRGMQVK